MHAVEKKHDLYKTILFSSMEEYYSRLSMYIPPFLKRLTDHQWSCTMAMWLAPQPVLGVSKLPI